MYTWLFWKDAFERSAKTAGQALITMFTLDEIVGIMDINFGQSASVAGLAALLSLLTSVVSAPTGDQGTASLVKLRTLRDSRNQYL